MVGDLVSSECAGSVMVVGTLDGAESKMDAGVGTLGCTEFVEDTGMGTLGCIT